MKTVDTIVVGAGQAGLAMSFHLRQRGRDHLLLERGRVAERWRSERWDSLRFQSPNWSIDLPGLRYQGDEPDGFASKHEVLHFIERYCEFIKAPVLRSAVSVLRCKTPGALFELTTDTGVWRARNVVVATGAYQRHVGARWQEELPGGLCQLQANEYRNPQSLPDGAILVIGSGASGCQIADELLEAGRRVFLSVGRHARVPRRYRGRDVFWWRLALGDLDRTAEQTPPALRSPGPLLTGVRGGYEVDLRRSARCGMTLLGRLVGVASGRLAFANDLEDNLRQGDEYRRNFLARIDAAVARAGLDVEAPSPLDEPQPPMAMASADRLDLAAQGIGVVIWSTGYKFDFDWIELPVFDRSGAPMQRRGASAVPGLYFVGLPWLHRAKSSFLCGMGEDAARIAAMINGDPDGDLVRSAPTLASDHLGRPGHRSRTLKPPPAPGSRG
ncbi:MAG TPA: NAD(P)-binding domain-containing protein [Gemmatimonadaceae bacterium]